ncbi:cupin domain-containing protein [Planctomicrobium sp. SH664]|uniref:cupin domain-containing protein n=1 Tax=Planctomicrobium sp. SH664 TaxID=3448125 RepID=UPI003F5BD473
MENLLSAIHGPLPEEVTATLLHGGRFRLERIVSQGHCSPPGFWYDQSEAEWVMLLSGAAILQLEESPEPLSLKPGDALLIPARCRHRVVWTDPERQTVWLAIFFEPGDQAKQ